MPTTSEFLRTDEDRQIFDVLISQLEMGRPYVAPPGVPADRVKILRDAFEKAAKDPELLGEAARMNLEISPLTGDQVQALIAELYATPPAVVEKVRNIMVVK